MFVRGTTAIQRATQIEEFHASERSKVGRGTLGVGEMGKGFGGIACFQTRSCIDTLCVFATADTEHENLHVAPIIVWRVLVNLMGIDSGGVLREDSIDKEILGGQPTSYIGT